MTPDDVGVDADGNGMPEADVTDRAVRDDDVTSDDVRDKVTRGADEPSESYEPLDVAGAVEAVLLVTDKPVSGSVLARVLECPETDVETALHSLATAYTQRRSGIDIRCVAGGWRLYTREDFSSYVERFLVDGQQARLTQAALETLAVIAYRQPVTRSRVSAVRGVNVDGVVRTLVTRGLVTEVGHDQSSGAALYATTELFLERLGLESLSHLPSLAPLLPELAELEDAEPPPESET